MLIRDLMIFLLAETFGWRLHLETLLWKPHLLIAIPCTLLHLRWSTIPICGFSLSKCWHSMLILDLDSIQSFFLFLVLRFFLDCCILHTHWLKPHLIRINTTITLLNACNNASWNCRVLGPNRRMRLFYWLSNCFP